MHFITAFTAVKLCFFEFFAIVLCNPLLSEQSVIPFIDKSKKNTDSSISSVDATSVDLPENWDFQTPPSYEIVNSVVRAPNVFHEVEEKVVAASEESKSKLQDSEKHIVHEIPDVLEKTHTEKEDFILDFKAFAGNNATKCNSSCASDPISTYTPETSSFLSTLRAEFSTSASNESTGNKEKLVAKARPAVDDLFELLSTMTVVLRTARPPEIHSTSNPSSLINVTDENTNTELFDEDELESPVSEKVSEEAYQTTDVNEKFEGAVSGEGQPISEITDAGEEPGDAVKAKANPKLDPQVILSSEFAKNGLKEEEGTQVVHGCGVVKEYSEQRQTTSECSKLLDESKKQKPIDDKFLHEKYSEEDEIDEKPLVRGHFERTLWEKLIAGLKCSHRDCGEALRPTNNVPRYLMQPSISRARKHSSGGHPVQ
ncbi:unnamed protein product [Gongylonema pulchrum]|uniref:Uncharacterized protein n=1 Tax=Gongylonema pulchrum TaxID=637853 RepID=A0A183CV22_9BILA|nr:unnamed protein product [Gongylonema pulchrum]